MSNENPIIHKIRRRAADFRSMSDPGNPIGLMAAPWGAHRKSMVRKADVANGRPLEIVAYANTSAVDLEREVVVPDGGDVRSYLTMNGNLFVDHQYDMEHVVAKCTRMALDPGGWLCTGQFFRGFETEYTRACVALAMAGTLAMSIGFEALDWGDPSAEEKRLYPGIESIVRRWKALEVSYTALPMNVTCRQVSTNLAAADVVAEKSRKALIDAHVSADVVKRFGIKPKRILILT
jgi:hypothetical protein